MTLFEKAPAKINLSLDVLGKRNDGHHDVEMIMTTIDLADRIELDKLQEDRIEVSLWSRYVPNDERNLAYKAAKLFKVQYGIKQGVHIKIEKNIPVSAGLGGGSTDAAAVLRGLNKLWDVGVSLEELALLGLKIDSDVPFCVYGSTAIAKGQGEIITRLPSPPSCWVILAKPDIGVSTKSIFHRVNTDVIPHPHTNAIIQALHEKDFHNICNHIGNSLEAVTMSIYPDVKRIKQKMAVAGADGVLMSGSGPTVYGLVQHHNKAQRIYNSMKGFCHDVHIVRITG
ncbi:4-(cytidine 5'-diphospho)-2-C-methyl-D-erythritol kinase [Ornithinibacillus salinisoli]|uniref:4-diphosphocytidyl-2-C-methyl-D-erythritol kinase n=1 Tax=Ornithinibacillus salinisoli TaxID=1848459 RepID=A0ABW4W2C0_9BACI